MPQKTITSGKTLIEKAALLCLAVLIYLRPAASVAQFVIIDEDFESRNLTAGEVAWSGDIENFGFASERGNTLLQLQADPSSSRSQLRTRSDAAYGSWEFYFRQEFSASNVNRSFIFLMADRSDLNYLDGSPVSGYAIRAGENGEPKKLRLIRFDQGRQTEILASETHLEPGRGYRVRVTRNHEGEWALYVASGHGSEPRFETGGIVDNTYSEASWFGLLARYTSRNTEAFYFDNFRVISTPLPLQVESVKPAGRRKLELSFNRELDESSIRAGAFHFDSGIEPVRAHLASSAVVELEFDETLAGGPDVLRISGVRDRHGQETDPDRMHKILITFSAEPGDVVINEILFDPIREIRHNDGTVDPGQSEYIELYNRTDYAVDLTGLHLRDRLNYDGEGIIKPADHPVGKSSGVFKKRSSGGSSGLPVNESSGVPYDTPVNGQAADDSAQAPAIWIPAGGYLLLYPEPEEAPFSESRVARFFELPDELIPPAVRFDRTTLSLPRSGRLIVLSDSAGTVLDHVDYRESWHNPNLIDTRGIALERIHPDLSSNDPSNWGSTADLKGGTPGRENTLFQNTEELPENGEAGSLTLAPNPFSPDGDGEEDHLFIRYRLDEPDYLIRVRIFDRYGRLVRTLTDSQPAGFEGTLIWDGLADDGQENRIGIYIILFEAYNSTTSRNRSFREAAVLARRF